MIKVNAELAFENEEEYYKFLDDWDSSYDNECI